MSGTAIDRERLTVATDDSELSTRVIDALSEATDTDPLEMEPLYRSVDTDALDALFKSGTTGVIRFEHDGHEVEVHGDGTVIVDGGAF